MRHPAIRTADRFTRLERIAALLAAERLGIHAGQGPLDPGWQKLHGRIRRDVEEILAQLEEPEFETRGGTQ